ncbi:MAG: Npt1/Npt2 family nucleotide transporter, partial [Desulfobacteraceae bacterium]|nr:Npt1/Npt2 family nucleotide transporter [Desulfobacteraceae bacterium]
MVDRITTWLNVYEKEIGLFLWTLVLLFLVRSSGIILNNYAETAFLKRYGVEFMPVVTMINAAVTVVIMGLLTGLIRSFPGPGLLAAMFAFCGLSVFGLRLLIPTGINLVYPLLFILKALYELLIAMLFWNLANDLFNTRQSKRLFPLISAGGVLGQILGSFGTPLLAAWLMLDNLLVVYLAVSLAGAAVVMAMMVRYPVLLKPAKRSAEGQKRPGLMAEISRIAPLMKQSTLLRIMVLLTLMPNVVIPILNYQFNYAVDSRFVTESGMLQFFAYFRGAMNVISLFILLFVGRIYGRWGLPVALMLHPLNYIVAFAALFTRFDLLSAVYARMSTNILRTTINIPANAVLMGLFPDDWRSLVRPFLRGTVVRAALFLGSLLILASAPLFHPRYLSLVALPFVLAWLVAPFWLKRRYVEILLDPVQQNRLDLKSLEPADIAALFRDRPIQRQIAAALRSADARDAAWYARLLHRSGFKGADALIVHRLPELPEDQQIELLNLISGDLSAQEMAVLQHLAAQGPAARTLATIRAANRLSPDASRLLDRAAYLRHPDPAVRAAAAAGLFSLAPVVYGPQIEQWMASPRDEIRLAGALAAGETRDRSFAPTLLAMLRQVGPAALTAACIEALEAGGYPDLYAVVAPFLSHPEAVVRRAAVASLPVTDSHRLQIAVNRLGDTDPQVRQTALERIAAAAFQDGKILIKALNRPDRRIREAVFELMERLKIPHLDIHRFARGRLEGAYKYLAEAEAAALLPACAVRDLLREHLLQQSRQLVDEVLRVLAYTDASGRVPLIRQGLYAADARQRANSQEALNDLLDRRMAALLIPLLDRDNLDQALKSARRRIQLPAFRQRESLWVHLLSRSEALTVSLAL